MSANRYRARGSQAETQPGSNDQVLRNIPGITEPAQMDEAELSLLLQLYECVMGDDFPERRLDVADLMEWHRLWLGNLYDWAGISHRCANWSALRWSRRASEGQG